MDVKSNKGRYPLLQLLANKLRDAGVNYDINKVEEVHLFRKNKKRVFYSISKEGDSIRFRSVWRKGAVDFRIPYHKGIEKNMTLEELEKIRQVYEAARSEFLKDKYENRVENNEG